MSCYTPLLGIPDGNPVGGIQRYKIGKYESLDALNGVSVGYIKIPCGKCLGCRLDYAKMWSDRLLLESLYHEHNWFVTLTYDDAHLPDPVLIEKGGVKFWADPLSHKDITKFLHDLRREIYPERFRYYLCGEYGPE